jgi:hypothetical protein
VRLRGRPAFRARRSVAVAVAALVCFAILGAALAASVVLDRPLSDFTREPQNALRGHFYVGFVAVIAMLIWWTAAAIALFTAAIATSERREFLVLGLAMAFLVLDDAFQVHEVVLTNEVGISQPIVYGAYLVVFLALLVAGRHFLVRHDTRMFAAAMALLVASVAVDVVEYFTGVHSRLVEEATKLLGIALLVVFTAGAAADVLKASTPRAGRRRSALDDEESPRARSPVPKSSS